MDTAFHTTVLFVCGIVFGAIFYERRLSLAGRGLANGSKRSKILAILAVVSSVVWCSRETAEMDCQAVLRGGMVPVLNEGIDRFVTFRTRFFGQVARRQLRDLPELVGINTVEVRQKTLADRGEEELRTSVVDGPGLLRLVWNNRRLLESCVVNVSATATVPLTEKKIKAWLAALEILSMYNIRELSPDRTEGFPEHMTFIDRDDYPRALYMREAAQVTCENWERLMPLPDLLMFYRFQLQRPVLVSKRATNSFEPVGADETETLKALGHAELEVELKGTYYPVNNDFFTWINARHRVSRNHGGRRDHDAIQETYHIPIFGELYPALPSKYPPFKTADDGFFLVDKADEDRYLSQE